MDTRREIKRRCHLSRRDVLTMAGGGLVAGLSLGPDLAVAQGTSHTFRVGAVECTVFSDGYLDMPASFVLPERDEAAIRAVFAASGQTFAGLRAEINVVLVNIGKDVILIDTGGGADFVPTVGKLAERLDAASIKPEQITKVVFTHAHADHLWGVIDPLTGDSMFEKAQHVMTAAERDYWLQADIATRVPGAFQAMANGTQRRLKAIAARLETVKPDAEIAPGVQLVDTSGHTPGHCSVAIRSGNEQLLIGGDVLTQSVVSFAEPGWRWGPDMDADKAIAARRGILDRLAKDRTRLLGYHLPWPGLGHVERHGTAYRFVPS